jgi:hypothetical protein
MLEDGKGHVLENIVGYEGHLISLDQSLWMTRTGRMRFSSPNLLGEIDVGFDLRSVRVGSFPPSTCGFTPRSRLDSVYRTGAVDALLGKHFPNLIKTLVASRMNVSNSSSVCGVVMLRDLFTKRRLRQATGKHQASQVVYHTSSRIIRPPMSTATAISDFKQRLEGTMGEESNE